MHILLHKCLITKPCWTGHFLRALFLRTVKLQQQHSSSPLSAFMWAHRGRAPVWTAVTPASQTSLSYVTGLVEKPPPCNHPIAERRPPSDPIGRTWTLPLYEWARVTSLNAVWMNPRVVFLRRRHVVFFFFRRCLVLVYGLILIPLSLYDFIICLIVKKKKKIAMAFKKKKFNKISTFGRDVTL